MRAAAAAAAATKARKTSLTPLKTWKPTVLNGEEDDEADEQQKKDEKAKKEFSSEIEAPRNNLLDSFNLYSALDKKDKLENTASYLPPVKEIVKKYSNMSMQGVPTREKRRSLDAYEENIKKFTRVHINDPGLVREKSMIEKSAFYASNSKLDQKKFQISSKKRSDFVDTANVNHRRQIMDAVRNSLPDINTVYKNETGLESRMNSFYYENLKRLNKHPVPFCESVKEHQGHEKDKRKHNCVFCSAQNQNVAGSLAPENTFIDETPTTFKPKTPKTPKVNPRLPILKLNNQQLLSSSRKEYNQAISALNPPEKTHKTYFCDVLGEKYCFGCIECHERRFAKVFEKKYMTDSDPLLVTMNLLMNQRISVK